MSPDTTDDYIDAYGLSLEAPSVLTEKEYSANVLFDERVLKSIENSEFKLDMSYEINKATQYRIEKDYC
jgi:hypothetical protein